MKDLEYFTDTNSYKCLAFSSNRTTFSSESNKMRLVSVLDKKVMVAEAA